MSVSVVTLKKYSELTGYSVRSLEEKVTKGIWLEGKHIIKTEAFRERCVDIVEVEKWLRNGGSFQAA